MDEERRALKKKVTCLGLWQVVSSWLPRATHASPGALAGTRGVGLPTSWPHARMLARARLPPAACPRQCSLPRPLRPGYLPYLGPWGGGKGGQVGTRWALHGAGILRAPAAGAGSLLLHGVGQAGWGARDRGEVGEPRSVRQDFRRGLVAV